MRSSAASQVAACTTARCVAMPRSDHQRCCNPICVLALMRSLGHAPSAFASEPRHEVEGVTAPAAADLDAETTQPTQTGCAYLGVRGVVVALSLAQSAPGLGHARTGMGEG